MLVRKRIRLILKILICITLLVVLLHSMVMTNQLELLKFYQVTEVPFVDKVELFVNETLLRRNLIQHVCENEDLLGKAPINRREYYVIKNETLVWCPVYKAASTSWIMNMFNLLNLNQSQVDALEKKFPSQLDRQLRAKSPIISLSEAKDLNTNNQTKSLIITRHPFSRMISAYRDKIERAHELMPNSSEINKNKDWYYKKYGQEMIKRYRKSYIQKFGNTSLSSENNYGSPFPTKHRSAELPTFWEFVQYLNSFSKFTTMDPHWRPINVFCSPCSFKFNYILKFENIQEEVPLFGRYLTNGDKLSQNWENKNRQNIPESEVLDKYFQILSDNDIKGLVKLYRLDFLMFNYTFSYRNIAYI